MTAFRYTFPGNSHDYIAAAMIVARESLSEKKARRVLVRRVPIVAAALWAVAALWGGLGDAIWVFPFIVLWFPLFTLYVLPYITRQQLASVAAADPALRGHLTRAFDDNAFAASGSDGSRYEVPWSSISEILESPDYWIFLIAPRGLAYIPKQATGAAEDERIRSWLAGNFPGRCRSVADS